MNCLPMLWLLVLHVAVYIRGVVGSGAAPSPVPTPTPTPTPSPSPTPTTATTTPVGGGECKGNDSRCAGSGQTQCTQLQNQGTDCRWDGPPQQGGACGGNDSRCAGSNQARCTQLQGQGTDCRWDSSATNIVSTSTKRATTLTTTGTASSDSTSTGRDTTSTTTTAFPGTTYTTPLIIHYTLMPGSPTPSPAPAPTPTPTPTPTPSPSPSPTTTTTTMVPVEQGECTGNDSRCVGSSQTQCTQLQNDGADCRWDSPTQPQQGSCNGNDSRCAGSNEARCTKLQDQGSDCRWVSSATSTKPTQADTTSTTLTTTSTGRATTLTTTSTERETTSIEPDTTSTKAGSSADGECTGNDPTCAGSAHAKCARLGQQGADCRWESANSLATSSLCAGSDPRCEEQDEQSCSSLSGCTWRPGYIVQGVLTLTVSDPESFAENPNATIAIKAGISNLTGVPPEYIDLDLYVVPERRLRGRNLQDAGTLIVTYVIVVGSDVPASVTVTSDEIDAVMQPSNIDSISTAISSKVKESFGSEGFACLVADVAPVVINSAISANSNTTTIFTPIDFVQDEDGAMSIGCAHPLLVVLGIALAIF